MADAPEGSAPPNSYDRDVLRSQMETLRREAAARAKLENEITAAHETERTAAQKDAEEKLAATRQKYARQIDATKREYAALLQQVAAQAAAEQKKLDEQRKAHAATILRTAAAHQAKLTEDEQWEDASFKEICKEKRKDPHRLFAKSEKELARTLSQLDEADQATLQALARWRIEPPAPPADQPPVEGIPAGADVLTQLEKLRASIIDQAQAILGLKAARTAFASGTLAGAIVVPVMLALAAGGSAFMFLTGETPFRLGVAGGTAVAVATLGIGAGLWLVGRLRRRARTQAIELRARLADDIARARTWHGHATDFIKARRDDQSRALEERFKQELADRQAALTAKLADIATRKDRQNADLDAKYRAKVEEIARKRDTNKEAADTKYPPRLTALDAACREDLERLEQARVARLAAADANRDDRWRKMTDRWREARSSTAAVYDAVSAIDAAAFRPWNELADEAVPLPTETPPGLRFGTQPLTLEKIPGGVSAHSELNAFGPISWS